MLYLFTGELKLKLIPDQCKSEEEKLIIRDNINIRPWSLTLGATQYLNFVTVKPMSYAWNSVDIEYL